MVCGPMDLAAALARTCTLLEDSSDSDWSNQSAAEIRETLESILDAVRAEKPYDREELVVQFMATGSVQETAMWNGWSDEYMALAEVVDRATARRPRWWQFWRT